MDRVDINDSLFKVLTNFGDHGLHHLFPAVDHALLAEVHHVFVKTCKEFDTELRMSCIVDMFFASFKQLARTERNLVMK
jgi:fatty acid desaturase